jgi:hypothetical protein
MKLQYPQTNMLEGWLILAHPREAEKYVAGA